MKLRVAFLALVATTTMSVVASAQQPWIRDRRYGEGIGIRAGDLELHPGISTEFGYDSNYFQRADVVRHTVPTVEEPRVGFWRLRVTPHLTLSTLGTERRAEEGQGEAPVVRFQAGMYASYNELFTADSSKPEKGSDYRHVAGGANFTMELLPERPFTFDFYGNYAHVVEPSNSPNEDFAFDRDSMRAGAGLTWRPGGGLFSWRGGYQIDYNLFDKGAFKFLNNAHHLVSTQTRWRFLPRTALLSDAEYEFVRFNDSTTTQNDGENVRVRLGISGLITNHFALMAMPGWGASFYKVRAGGVPPRNYDGPIGRGELRWFLMPRPTLESTSAAVGLSSIALGYTRKYDTSYYATFYTRDRFYIDFYYLIGGALLLGANAGYSFVHYPETEFQGGGLRTPSFGERRIDTEVFAEYRFSDVVALNTTLRYDQRMSDVEVPFPGGQSVDILDFKRFQAYVGLRLFW